MKKSLFIFLLMLVVSLLGFAGGIAAYRNLTVDHYASTAPGVLFEAVAPLDIPSLRELTDGAATDTEALQRVVTYANTHDLTSIFAERQHARAQALLAMYWVHTAALYGTVEVLPTGVLDFVQRQTAHCGTYADAQIELLSALNIPWRRVEITGGTHQFIEVQINGQWEVTDATINIWIDRPADALMDGVDRTIRRFYSPMHDQAYLEQYDAGLLAVAQDLRLSLPLLGVGWQPKARIAVTDASTVRAWTPPAR